PMAREWAWDFEKMDFKLKDGKMYQVEGKEAVKIWLWKLFMTARYRQVIFDWDYGHELENLIGQGYTQGYLNSEAERYVREAIEYNLKDYVTDVRNVNVSFDEGTLTIEFTAITPYGEVEVRV
ncbi:MAG TPA: DUF2634 domain-containing protein, partial [Defluviitaleaceae bacterium]|nr:DUF2634 domain-containing protein [Defluviitaleaceae bacterium]